MNSEKDFFKRSEVWKIATIAIALLLMSVPFFVNGTTDAQNTVTSGLFAPLTGSPIGGMTPQGLSRSSTELGVKVFETNVSNVNLPANTNLSVVVDGNSIGQIILSPLRGGILRLTGSSAPTVNAGSTVAVKNGTTTILSGTFVAPPSPTPTASVSPSPSISPTPTRTPTPTPTPFPTPSLVLYAPLTGSTIDGIMPSGVGQYAEFGTTSKALSVFVNRVNYPIGTILDVSLGNTSIGQITLRDCGEGALRIMTNVPTVVIGDTLTVKKGTTTVLSGTFRAVGPTVSPTPTPSVSPSPSPSVSPTATPTPRPPRFFNGRMGGSQVVPPVTGEGRGLVAVALNEAGTQIRVWVGYFGLSSNASSVKIYGPAETGANGSAIFDLGTVTGTSGRIFDKTFDVTAAQVAQLRAGMWYAQIATANNANGEIRGQIRSHTRPSGFNGAVADDVAVYRQSSGTWYISIGTNLVGKVLGQAGDIPVSADYDGDGITDIAVYRGGTWIINRSSDNGTTYRQFGLTTDIPVRGDFDGDGQNDITVYRDGNWYSMLSSNGSFRAMQFGLSGDIPLAGDYDGDGSSDICVFRPSSGDWYRLESKTGAFWAVHFGATGDVPVVGDYDGDGRDDVTVYRPSVGDWYQLRSSTGEFYGVHWGISEDIPVPVDLDGDGATDISVFRPSNGFWYTYKSSDGAFDFRQFGMIGDIPTSAR